MVGRARVLSGAPAKLRLEWYASLRPCVASHSLCSVNKVLRASRIFLLAQNASPASDEPGLNVVGVRDPRLQVLGVVCDDTGAKVSRLIR